MKPVLNHFDGNGNAVMVDVSQKPPTSRIATAQGKIKVSEAVLDAITCHTAAKGDVLGTAQIAGIMAAKRTAELIPLCHPLAMSHCAVTFTVLRDELAVLAECTAKINAKTGVEMEALTGVSVALLTIYDMCKAIDKSMEIGEIRLVYKKAENPEYSSTTPTRACYGRRERIKKHGKNQPHRRYAPASYRRRAKSCNNKA